MRAFLIIAAIIAVIVLAILYARCGGSLGVGGGSKVGVGGGSPRARTALARDAGVPRCQVRVSGAGLEVDGKVATVEAVVAACTKPGAADVVVTGDALQGAWDGLKAALHRARVETFVRDARPAAPPS